MSGEATKVIKQTLAGVTLNGQPVHVFIEEENQREADKLHADEVRKHSQGAGYTAPTSKYGNTSGARTQNRNSTGVLSPEILAHVNYLFEKGGEKAVAEYMSMPQSKVDQSGPIEAALRDAHEKMRFYHQQEQKAREEGLKWTSVAEQLQGALAIMTGKVPVNGSRGSGRPKGTTNAAVGRLGKGVWVEAMEQILANGRTIPRQQLLDELRETFPNSAPTNASTALSNALARGSVELLEDGSNRVRLPLVQAPVAAGSSSQTD